MHRKTQKSFGSKGPRERLLAVAEQCFYKQGYQATGISQLIDEAKIAKASFYDHFADKESLYCTFLQHKFETWVSEVKKRISTGSNPSERIMAIFEFLEEWMTKDNFRGCPFINSASEFPEPRSRVRVSVKQAKDELRALIRSQISGRTKLSSKGSTDELADQLYVLVDGAIVTSQIHRDIWPVRAAARVAESLMGG